MQQTPQKQPRIIIIAGPNGAGKTTFARQFLPEVNCPEFINADMIAEQFPELPPELAAVKAARVMLTQIAEGVAARSDFAIETTLAGRGYLQSIKDWRRSGYVVKLFFLTLLSAEDAIRRVAARGQQGGHNIPEDVIRRRFEAGLHNFRNHYRYAVDFWREYNNEGEVPELVDEGSN